MNNQSIFDKIDTSFSGEENKSKMYLVFGSIAALIGWVMFTTFEPMGQEYLDSATAKNNTLTNNLNADRAFMAENTNPNDPNDKKWKINKKKQEIAGYVNQYNEYKNTNIYIAKRLKELSYLLFDDKNWANFLDSISETAKKYNVKINEIKSKINKLERNKPQQILSVEVDLQGDYHGVVKFINSLEESLLIVDISDIDLEGKEDVQGIVKIGVWGMKY